MMYRETKASRTPVAFMRGPVVYCLDMIDNPGLGNDDMDISGMLTVSSAIAPVRVEHEDGTLLAPAYKTEARYCGAPVSVILTPFANIGRWHRDDSFVPAHNAPAFSYALWLYE